MEKNDRISLKLPLKSWIHDINNFLKGCLIFDNVCIYCVIISKALCSAPLVFFHKLEGTARKEYITESALAGRWGGGTEK